jgi:cytoskeletal protein CcmA (bactofilin family)
MKRTQTTLSGFLDKGCTIQGDVTFTDLLRIHGSVVGKVMSEDELLVGEGGVVEGEVVVARLMVAGTVRGTVRVTERLVVHSSGRVLAEVHAPRLVVDEGGLIEGAVHMSDGDSPLDREPRKS